MAEKTNFLDVWIVDTNMVYRDVPYTVVADWVQQGRLLENDMLRSPGATEWQPLTSLPAFAPYLPKTEPHRAEDQAEALEPVQVDFAWKPHTPGEDEDVDMIPLIDVSLVLLIFFMMTAAVTGIAPFIPIPIARQGSAEITSNLLWIGIDRRADGTPVYSLGQGDRGPEERDRNLTEAEVLQRLDEVLNEKGRAKVTIKADRHLPLGIVGRINVALEARRAQGLVPETYAGVVERDTP